MGFPVLFSSLYLIVYLNFLSRLKYSHNSHSLAHQSFYKYFDWVSRIPSHVKAICKFSGPILFTIFFINKSQTHTGTIRRKSSNKTCADFSIRIFQQTPRMFKVNVLTAGNFRTDFEQSHRNFVAAVGAVPTTNTTLSVCLEKRPKILRKAGECVDDGRQGREPLNGGECAK